MNLTLARKLSWEKNRSRWRRWDRSGSRHHNRRKKNEMPMGRPSSDRGKKRMTKSGSRKIWRKSAKSDTTKPSRHYHIRTTRLGLIRLICLETVSVRFVRVIKQGSVSRNHSLANCVSVAQDGDSQLASDSVKNILARREHLVNERCKAAKRKQSKTHFRRETDSIATPSITNLQEELRRAETRHEKYQSNGYIDSWADVKYWRKIALALILKRELNDKQMLAFLLLVDNIGSQSETEHALKPFRMLVTGLGGTGKSRYLKLGQNFMN
ncbi:hypothetical protein C8R45DRAFT_1146154 [Mycena sanguinolenta]|nr:hypothetical protein C8R45DRAFT_1146154 [Mycena sanguinolenta]